MNAATTLWLAIIHARHGTAVKAGKSAMRRTLSKQKTVRNVKLLQLVEQNSRLASSVTGKKQESATAYRGHPHRARRLFS
jgi:hypothetical protein